MVGRTARYCAAVAACSNRRVLIRSALFAIHKKARRGAGLFFNASKSALQRLGAPAARREGGIDSRLRRSPLRGVTASGDVLRRPLAGWSNRRVLIRSALSARHKKARRGAGLFYVWRRGRDSNPRYGNPYGSLAGNWFQPLTHLSGTRSLFHLTGRPRDVPRMITMFGGNYSSKIKHSRRSRWFFRAESAGKSLHGVRQLPWEH